MTYFNQIENLMLSMGYSPPTKSESPEIWTKKLYDCLLDLSYKVSPKEWKCNICSSVYETPPKFWIQTHGDLFCEQSNIPYDVQYLEALKFCGMACFSQWWEWAYPAWFNRTNK